jgi:hypothetical protein
MLRFSLPIAAQILSTPQQILSPWNRAEVSQSDQGNGIT